jgi:hypothetical protein
MLLPPSNPTDVPQRDVVSMPVHVSFSVLNAYAAGVGASCGAEAKPGKIWIVRGVGLVRLFLHEIWQLSAIQVQQHISLRSGAADVFLGFCSHGPADKGSGARTEVDPLS